MKKITLLWIVLILSMYIQIDAQDGEQTPHNPIITPENADQIVELMMIGRGSITDVTYSPDGQTVLVASLAGIWVYDADNLETPIRLLKGHTQRVKRVVYRPDGRRFASLSSDDTVHVWDAETGETVYVFEPLEPHPDYTLVYITAIAYSPDNRMLATASSNGIIQIWDSETGENLGVLEGHLSLVESLVFSPDNRKLASSSWDYTIRIWDTKTGETLQILEAGEKLEHPEVDANAITSIMYSSDGQQLVSAGWDKIVRIWDAEKGIVLKELVGHTTESTRVVYSPNSQTIASVSWGDAIRIWDAETGEIIRIIESANASNILAYSPDGQTITVGEEFWDAETGELIHVLQGHEQIGDSLAFSPNGNILASGAGSKIFLWDAKTWLSLNQFEGTKRVDTLIFSPDGNWLASASWADDITYVWDIETGEIVQSISIPAYRLAFSPDNQTLVIGSGDFVYLFDVETWLSQEIKMPDTYRGGVSSLAFSPNGRFITTAVSDVAPIDIPIWDVETLETVQTLSVSGGYPIENIVYRPDSMMIAGSNYDRTIFIWNVETGDGFRRLEGIADVIRTITYNPDGRMIISGNDDGTIEMWDIEERKIVTILQGHTGGLTTIAFSPDGRFIASGSWDGTIRIWGVANNE